MPTTSPVLRVGNGAGFWGDNLDAPYLLARDGRLDVLTLEYLAELTLAILSHLRARDPAAGHVADFVDLLPRLTPLLREQDRLRIVTNAGGLNPRSCATQCARVLESAGLGQEVIAVVEGDDVVDSIPHWLESNIDLAHMETGEPIVGVAKRLIAANVYLGARGISEALHAGARIVITGRVADASLTLGPAVAQFGWGWEEYDHLAGATVAGHLIECGAQATGGLWRDWETLPHLDRMGYPIAEIHPDGSAVITKPEGSGGCVTTSTIAEQLVYEIDDPACYRTPDVNVDLTRVGMDSIGPDRVHVFDAAGRPPSDRLKLAAVYRDGWTASGLLAIVGHRAATKARRVGEVILDRVRAAGVTLQDSLVECLGAGDVVPGVMPMAYEPVEVILRVTARDPDRRAIERFCREFAAMITSGPPGLAGYASGRPIPRPAFAYWPALVPRELVSQTLTARAARGWLAEVGQGRCP